MQIVDLIALNMYKTGDFLKCNDMIISFLKFLLKCNFQSEFNSKRRFEQKYSILRAYYRLHNIYHLKIRI